MGAVQGLALQHARYGGGQHLIATGQNQEVGPCAEVLQGARQLVGRPVDAAREFRPVRIVTSIHWTGEGRDAVQGADDVGRGVDGTEASGLDTQPGKLGPQPVDGGVVMTAAGMDGGVDDERLHHHRCSLRQAGR